jgi:hypothetical protein
LETRFSTPGVPEQIDLFVSDGTPAGTTQLIWTGSSAERFVTLGNKVLFEASNTSNKPGLWVTDGTSAGTMEISVPNAYFNGIFSGVNFQGAVVGGEVVFSGTDNLGVQDLWVTDGTAAGTKEIVSPLVTQDPKSIPSSSAPSSSPPSDFDGGGNSGLLFQNSSGEGDIWELNGTTVLVAGSIGNPGPSWHIKATGDFNGDGFADILWQNDDGSVAIWEMHGTSMIGGAIVANPGASWHAVGTGDFNHDGHADILWQSSDGSVAIWEMNGASLVGSAIIGQPGPDWHVIGSGDFNGDGFSDVLLQNSSGEVFVWEMNGTSLIGAGSLGNPGPTWHAIGTGDFNGPTSCGRMTTARWRCGN